jgi:hypothetical protein
MKKIMIAAILLMVNFFAHAENKFIESGEKKTISLVSKDTKLMEMLKINPANKNTWKILEGGKETPGFNVVFDTEKTIYQRAKHRHANHYL